PARRSSTLVDTLMLRPCSSHVYQLTLTPIRLASSSLRKPGVRLRQSLRRPNSSGESAARRAFRKRESISLCSCSDIGSLPLPLVHELDEEHRSTPLSRSPTLPVIRNALRSGGSLCLIWYTESAAAVRPEPPGPPATAQRKSLRLDGLRSAPRRPRVEVHRRAPPPQPQIQQLDG